MMIEVSLMELADIVDALAWSGSKNGWLARATKRNPTAAQGHAMREARAMRLYRRLNRALRIAAEEKK
jgi:hypothetical protein